MYRTALLSVCTQRYHSLPYRCQRNRSLPLKILICSKYSKDSVFIIRSKIHKYYLYGGSMILVTEDIDLFRSSNLVSVVLPRCRRSLLTVQV